MRDESDNQPFGYKPLSRRPRQGSKYNIAGREGGGSWSLQRYNDILLASNGNLNHYNNV